MTSGTPCPPTDRMAKSTSFKANRWVVMSSSGKRFDASCSRALVQSVVRGRPLADDPSRLGSDRKPAAFSVLAFFGPHLAEWPLGRGKKEGAAVHSIKPIVCGLGLLSLTACFEAEKRFEDFVDKKKELAALEAAAEAAKAKKKG